MKGQCRSRLSACASFVVLAALVAAPPASARSEPDRVTRLNQAFLRHLRRLDTKHAIAVATIEQAWENTYRDGLAESFVPDALAVLYPRYREALAAFDADRMDDVVRILQPLLVHEDGFLAANARYFHVRAQVALERYEEVEDQLATLDSEAESLVAHTPYAPHLWFILAVCQARDLRFEQAAQTLAALRATFPDAPESVSVGAAQLTLEIERRERGTLDEVATVMEYVADRLNAADRATRVRDRQEEIIAMLDRLIEEHEQQEKKCGGGGGRQSRGGQRPAGSDSPSRAKEKSDAPAGAGRVGDLHGAPKANPGQAWGKLPPAERERILQSIRERFPSRYRRLVEQYYRSLAEESDE